eukprot:m.74250 g.74250  ORF g.74250 m.74250 type:complete len:757 (-) comp12453_c0_seq4:2317-4587(-)
MAKEEGEQVPFILWFRRYMHAANGLDIRSLAAMRILIGISIIYDITTAYMPYSETMLSDQPGTWFPRKEHIQKEKDHLSILMSSGSPVFVNVFLYADLLAAICFIVGYNTKASHLALYILHSAVYDRYPLAINGGDSWFMAFMPIAYFLPLDRVWAVSPGSSHETQTVTSLASFVVWMMYMCLYVRNWECKTHSHAYNVEYSAVSIVLGNDLISRFAKLFRPFPQFCKFLTMFTMIAEGPFAAVAWLCPWPVVRFTCIFCLIGMHAGFHMFLHLGLFPWVCMAILVGALPREVWDTLDYLRGHIRNTTKENNMDSVENQPISLWNCTLSFVGGCLCLLWSVCPAQMGENKDLRNWLNQIPWVSIVTYTIGAVIFFAVTGYEESLRMNRISKFLRRAKVASQQWLLILLLTMNMFSNYLPNFYKRTMPIGLYCVAANGYGPGAVEYKFIAAGITDEDPGIVQDWFPWKNRFSSFVVPNHYTQPRPISMYDPATSSEYIFATRFHKPMEWANNPNRHRWLCSLYSEQGLSLYQLYMIKSEYIPETESDHPRLVSLYSASCKRHVSGCEAGNELHPDCPWSNITATMQREFAKAYPVTPGKKERLLKPYAVKGAKVRYISNVSTHGKIVKNAEGELVGITKDISRPVLVYWSGEHGIYEGLQGVSWDQLEYITPRNELESLKEREQNLLLKLGQDKKRVRMKPVQKFETYEKWLKPGTLGVFQYHEENFYPCNVLWEVLREGEKKNMTHWVHPFDLDIL